MDSRIDPTLFGPLGADPVLETGPSQLFPGETELLSKSAIAKKLALLDSIQGILDGVLAEDEKVLYLLAAQQNPRIRDYIGLGFWFIHLHRVALVLTDKRLIEVLLDLGGKPATRIRSYSWAGRARLKLGLGKLTIATLSGVKQAWRVSARGDRKFLKLLVPNIVKRFEQFGAPLAEADEYYWHCPSCWSRISPDPETCAACGTKFRTPRMATLLSLAFPGAGLFYAQRPVLGTFDLVGEVMLYVALLFTLAIASGAEEISLGAGLMGFLIVLTKLESVHVSGLMVRRARSITGRAEANWRRLAYGGGLLSVAALAIAFSATGSLSFSLARDLDFDVRDSAWIGTRSAAEFLLEDDDSQRSRWYNQETGLDVTVFAYPQQPWFGYEEFRRDFLTALQEGGSGAIVVEEKLPAGLEGFYCILRHEIAHDRPVLEVTFLLWDEESPAVHQVTAFVEEGEQSDALDGLRALLAVSEWIPAIEPELGTRGRDPPTGRPRAAMEPQAVVMRYTDRPDRSEAGGERMASYEQRGA